MILRCPSEKYPSSVPPLVIASRKVDHRRVDTPYGWARLHREFSENVSRWNVFTQPSSPLRTMLSVYAVLEDGVPVVRFPSLVMAREVFQELVGKVHFTTKGVPYIVTGCEPFFFSLHQEPLGWNISGPDMTFAQAASRALYEVCRKTFSTRKEALAALNTWWYEEGHSKSMRIHARSVH